MFGSIVRTSSKAANWRWSLAVLTRVGRQHWNLQFPVSKRINAMLKSYYSLLQRWFDFSRRTYSLGAPFQSPIPPKMGMVSRRPRLLTFMVILLLGLCSLLVVHGQPNNQQVALVTDQQRENMRRSIAEVCTILSLTWNQSFWQAIFISSMIVSWTKVRIQRF